MISERDNAMRELAKYILLGGGLLVLGFGNHSCASDVEIRLTRTERARIDTIYLQQIDTLKSFTDSFCVAITDELLQAAVDSIVALRKIESEELKARYHPSIDQPELNTPPTNRNQRHTK